MQQKLVSKIPKTEMECTRFYGNKKSTGDIMLAALTQWHNTTAATTSPPCSQLLQLYTN